MIGVKNVKRQDEESCFFVDAAFNAKQKKKEMPSNRRRNTKNLTTAKMPPNRTKLTGELQFRGKRVKVIGYCVLA